MTMPKGRWLVRDRAAFIACLTETGDVRAAVRAAGRSLVSAFHLRDIDPEFASAWARAIDHAWELLEGAMLGGLLQAAGAMAAPAMPEADADTPVKTVPTRAAPRATASPDWKLVLAALAQRPKPAARKHGRIDGAAVARLRAEIAALPKAGTPIANAPRASDASP